MAAVLKTALAAICMFTLLATVYLTASLAVLRPPRANYTVWFGVAGLIVIAGVAIFAAMVSPRPWLRPSALVIGVVLVIVGAWMVRETLTSAHFEGYALVLGSALTAQGILALMQNLRRYPAP